MRYARISKDGKSVAKVFDAEPGLTLDSRTVPVENVSEKHDPTHQELCFHKYRLGTGKVFAEYNVITKQSVETSKNILLAEALSRRDSQLYFNIQLAEGEVQIDLNRISIFTLFELHPDSEIDWTYTDGKSFKLTKKLAKEILMAVSTRAVKLYAAHRADVANIHTLKTFQDVKNFSPVGIDSI